MRRVRSEAFKDALWAADLRKCSERVTRIELALSAWEADVLPLNYTRKRPPDYLSAVGAREHPLLRDVDAETSVSAGAPSGWGGRTGRSGTVRMARWPSQSRTSS